MDLQSLKRELDKEKRMQAAYVRLAAYTDQKIQTLENQITKIERKRVQDQHKYLFSVNDEFLNSPPSLKTIGKNAKEHISRTRFKRRDERLEDLRSSFNKKARIEVAYCADEEVYLVKVYYQEILFDSIEAQKWNKEKIKRVIDSEARPRIPWTQIHMGLVWKFEARLSPYYLEDVIEADVIQMPSKRFSLVNNELNHQA
jgi:hypothetical protein